MGWTKKASATLTLTTQNALGHSHRQLSLFSCGLFIDQSAAGSVRRSATCSEVQQIRDWAKNAVKKPGNANAFGSFVFVMMTAGVNGFPTSRGLRLVEMRFH